MPLVSSIAQSVLSDNLSSPVDHSFEGAHLSLATPKLDQVVVLLVHVFYHQPHCPSIVNSQKLQRNVAVSARSVDVLEKENGGNFISSTRENLGRLIDGLGLVERVGFESPYRGACFLIFGIYRLPSEHNGAKICLYKPAAGGRLVEHFAGFGLKDAVEREEEKFINEEGGHAIDKVANHALGELLVLEVDDYRERVVGFGAHADNEDVLLHVDIDFVPLVLVIASVLEIGQNGADSIDDFPDSFEALLLTELESVEVELVLRSEHHST